MEDKETRTCDGHCDRCNMNQRTYCSAQMAYYNQQEIAEIKAILTKKDSEAIQTIQRDNKVARIADDEAENEE